MTSQQTNRADELAESWRQHVRKMESELSLSDRDQAVREDPGVWGAYDIPAMLSIRDRLENALSMESRPDIDEVRSRVDSVDDAYRGATVEDAQDLVLRMREALEEPTTDLGWWWHRIPRSGPMREELEKYFGG